MNIYPIDLGSFKLDGGAMFGVVPKVLWNKVYPADENNLVPLALRSMLIVEGDRKIVIDAGIGEKMDPKLLKHYYLDRDTSIDSELQKHDLTPDDITDVILTHLHFDHCGGAVKYDANDRPVPTFPNASYWVGAGQWHAATHPNAREKSSFFKENFMPIEENGQLKLVEQTQEIAPGVRVRLYSGHTDGQLVPFIQYGNQTIVYTADLIPAAANVSLAWITAFDMEPKIALEEKKEFLEEAYTNQYVLFFEHDIFQECCSLKQTEKGVRVKDTFSLSDII